MKPALALGLWGTDVPQKRQVICKMQKQMQSKKETSRHVCISFRKSTQYQVRQQHAQKTQPKNHHHNEGREYKCIVYVCMKRSIIMWNVTCTMYIFAFMYIYVYIYICIINRYSWRSIIMWNVTCTCKQWNGHLEQLWFSKECGFICVAWVMSDKGRISFNPCLVVGVGGLPSAYVSAREKTLGGSPPPHAYAYTHVYCLQKQISISIFLTI
jgi:hypothetical protein